MPRGGLIENLVGRRFNHWTVLRPHPSFRAKGGSHGQPKKVTKWICRCDCGTTKEFFRFQLTGKKSSKWCKGCGNTKNPAYTAAHLVMKDYQRAAERRGFPWSLTFEEFVEITTSPCFYTGRAPSQIRTALNGTVHKFHGIDRLDSSLGYVSGNCVSCCFEVNRMKSDMSPATFFNLLDEIRFHCGGKDA